MTEELEWNENMIQSKIPGAYFIQTLSSFIVSKDICYRIQLAL